MTKETFIFSDSLLQAWADELDIDDDWKEEMLQEDNIEEATKFLVKAIQEKRDKEKGL